ncbi:DUF6044 family protein [Heyndrickxia sp. NPDC080065]|uniref:DUF6044 family protein n=1 Tax=Heyndrickxia sp. NPDC080065 TaxID=3390568 RepID=UPI003D01B48E
MGIGRGLQNKERLYMLIAILIILIWVAPYFILGQDAHVRVHDNLDSNLGWYKVLKESGQLFAPIDAPFQQIFNGEMTRDAFYSQFNGMIILFSLLTPMIAYGVSQLITRVLAFIGMYLLLKKYVIKERPLGLIQVGAALTFALTPYWPSGMLSILGMPLALWAFLNIRNGEKSWVNYVILTILPFLSSFVLGFFFFLSGMGIFWLVDIIRTKKWNLKFFFSIAYMTVIYLLIDYRLVASMLLPHEPTNRDAFYESKNSLIETFTLILKNYVFSHNQDRTVSELIILPLTIVTLVIILAKKQWKKEKLFIGLHILNLLLSIWYAFWFYEGWQPLKDRVGLLTSFNFARYHYLRPLVIYALFALSLRYIWQLGKWGKSVAIICIIAQIYVLIPYNEQIAYKNQPSYRQYFAEEQFNEIKKFIGKPVEKYRVVSIGMHPDIAQYNGFYTLDSYSNLYPLSYKEEFRKIIAPELSKSKYLADYYDHWGGRVYVFVDELGKHYMFSKNSSMKITNLQLNIKQLKQMGGEYIISAVPILNAEENKLSLQKVFESNTSYWKIYLYHVK